jgi:opacity protein-like surface antigen
VYTNTLVWNDSTPEANADIAIGNQGSVVGNSVSHAFSAGLQHRFTRDLSGGASYTFSMTNSEEPPDTQSHAASADFAYLIDPRTTVSFRAFGMLIDQSQGTSDVSTSETNAKIFGTTFGARRQLMTSLAAFVAVGPALVIREGRPTRGFANWQVGLDGALPNTRRTSLSFSTQQSIQDTAGDINDVGLVLSRSATLTLNHSLSHDLLASAFANFSREQVLDDSDTGVSTQDQVFTLWNAGVRFSYALSPMWSISGTYRYQRGDSDVPESNVDSTRLGGKYSENRVIFSLTAAFSVF